MEAHEPRDESPMRANVATVGPHRRRIRVEEGDQRAPRPLGKLRRPDLRCALRAERSTFAQVERQITLRLYDAAIAHAFVEPGRKSERRDEQPHRAQTLGLGILALHGREGYEGATERVVALRMGIRRR